MRFLERHQPVCEPTPDPCACYGQIGLDFVRRYPVAYVLRTPFEIVKLLFAPLPGPQALIHNGLVGLAIASAGWLAIQRRLQRDQWLAIGFVLAYLAACVVDDTQQGYLVPMLPMIAAFATVPVGAVVLPLARRAWLLRPRATHPSSAG